MEKHGQVMKLHQTGIRIGCNVMIVPYARHAIYDGDADRTCDCREKAAIGVVADKFSLDVYI